MMNRVERAVLDLGMFLIFSHSSLDGQGVARLEQLNGRKAFEFC